MPQHNPGPELGLDQCKQRLSEQLASAARQIESEHGLDALPALGDIRRTAHRMIEDDFGADLSGASFGVGGAANPLGLDLDAAADALATGAMQAGKAFSVPASAIVNEVAHAAQVALQS